MIKLRVITHTNRGMNVIIFLMIIGLTTGLKAQNTPCDFAVPSLEQAKWPDEAKCLLRPVKRFAILGPKLERLPSPLDRLIGQPVAPTVSIDSLKNFLNARGMVEADVGGLLNNPLSSPRYFVIHDTSTLLQGGLPFPDSINQETWAGNKLSNMVTRKVTHVYINRVGKSATAVDFNSITPRPGTKYEVRHPDRKKLFLHIENVQPRFNDERGIDSIAPNPGFTEAQLDRLALVYVAASVRRGLWLIPTYHAAVDAGIPNQHDDPQNFDLNQWASRITILLKSLESNGPVDSVASDASTLSNASAGLPQDAVERVINKYANKLKNSRYMEKNCEPTTYPDYEGLPLTKCKYSVKDSNGVIKTATVIMFNPSIEQLARWVVNTCMEVKGNASPSCTDKLFDHVIGQSGGQFPVAGIVFEDIIPEDGFTEIYVFRHGVTVVVSGVEHRSTRQPTDEEIEKSLFGEVKRTFRYARIQGTTREEYKANGATVDVGDSKTKRKLTWLEVSRDLYKAAWGKDRNELMIAWARTNL